jgi:hypothetical protein
LVSHHFKHRLSAIAAKQNDGVVLCSLLFLPSPALDGGQHHLFCSLKIDA